MRQPSFRALLLACLLPLSMTLSGCGASGSAIIVKGTPADVGVTKVAVMPGSQLTGSEANDAMVGESLDNMYPVTGFSWEFEVKATQDQIKDFFAAKYPDAELTIEPITPEEDEEADEDMQQSAAGATPLNDMEFVLRTVGPQVEYVKIYVYNGSYMIYESVRK